MSALTRLAAASLIASACGALGACSGSKDQTIHNLATAGKDAAVDADEASDRAAGETEDAGSDAVLDAQSSGSLDAAEPRGDGDPTEVEAGPLRQEPEAGAALDGSDGSAWDGGSDAATIAANDAQSAGSNASDAGAPPNVRLTLTRGGVPIPEAYVLYHGVEEQLIGTGSTNARGSAETDLDVRLVSVLIPQPNDSTELQLFTYFGVQAGDDLKLDVPDSVEAEALYQLSLTPYEGATQYDANGGPDACARGGGSLDHTDILVAGPPRCLAPTDNALLVSAWTTTANDTPLLAAYALAQGLRAPTSAEAPLAVQVGPFAAYRDVHVRTHAAPNLTSISLSLQAMLGKQALTLASKSGRADLVGDGDVEFGAPTFAFDAFRARSAYAWSANQYERVTWSSGSDAPRDFDYADALPLLSGLAVDADTLSAPAVYWTTEDAAQRDAILFEVSLRVRDPAQTRPITWAGMAPPDHRRVRLPPLPEEVLASLPVDSGAYWEARRVSALASSRLEGYDGARKQRVRYVNTGLGPLLVPELDGPGQSEVNTLDRND